MQAVRIVIVVLWVAAVAILHLFGNNIGTFVVLVVSITVPLLAAAWLACAKVQPQLTAPASVEKGGLLECEISLSGIIARFCGADIVLKWENSFVGEGGVLMQPLGKLLLPMPYCGVVHVKLDALVLTDPFGLFTRRIASSACVSTFVKPCGMQAPLPPMHVNTAGESNQYSATQAGQDASETYAIREYIPGDMIRSIHWKLTQKLDCVMVRELGLPLGYGSVLLWVSTGHNAPAVDWDIAGELLCAMAKQLVLAGAQVGIGWYAPGGVVVCDVACEADIFRVAYTFFAEARQGQNLSQDYAPPPLHSHATRFDEIKIIYPGGRNVDYL